MKTVVTDHISTAAHSEQLDLLRHSSRCFMQLFNVSHRKPRPPVSSTSEQDFLKLLRPSHTVTTKAAVKPLETTHLWSCVPKGDWYFLAAGFNRKCNINKHLLVFRLMCCSLTPLLSHDVLSSDSEPCMSSFSCRGFLSPPGLQLTPLLMDMCPLSIATQNTIRQSCVSLNP